MSILIKGIDIPNSGQIELIIGPHGKVFSNTRGIYAEAIQIPKDHGRLIDADALIERLKRLKKAEEDSGDKVRAGMVQNAIYHAEVMPVYEVVTCGECKYWHEGEWYNTCDKHIGHGFEDDYFCKYGERREDL